ncbi:dolichyl-phosphate-mannose-protein mannosyltransferase [Yamadazyma tenuis]|uniref:Dolichyl-phosphate-mannose--protein mannosyltransferase n=1 Tax=Candida tenuis (strain ATCC 10573 / BCRC 21748 / CBS 615 / JCM 9827 / NBRC 10315 / NRRL Y-1498 / VKM Y-70) TaxID=590646 RepID=G3AXZ7_CANTC|nr:PMT-domain-containing protein [Yamadazyma tenuis ATCC 10573]EGV65733.1 PMT-domain-containing protein [Yamadazyma tenuis ATCC 10573]WEJ95950.1 dolichyl-phosphate-mannose-protein mannosyltransferase [Yamadazyma tenuis]
METPQANTYASGSAQYVSGDYDVSQRIRASAPDRTFALVDEEAELNAIIDKTSNLNLSSKGRKSNLGEVFIKYINPILLTAVSAFFRLYRLDGSKHVTWDEAHFGKFGSHYIKHEFYFDVHPPLGKLLVALSGYLAGSNGEFTFPSSGSYPEDVNYVAMRAFNCIFGILCTPLAYKTAVVLGFSQFSVWFITLQVIFEMVSLTLSKFILLDSFLLFFTVLSFYCLAHIHRLRMSNTFLTYDGIKWLSITGLSIGCVCSVKWVGMFVTALIGFYIIYDLLIKTYQLRSKKYHITVLEYLLHWLTRIVTLIIIPFVLYLSFFKIHFALLTRSGPGDGSTSTLLQANLEDTSIKIGPRSVGYGSLVTLRSQGLSPNLLHSHPHNYPEGSQQQQVTTYGFKDNNNEFVFEFDLQNGLNNHFATLEADENTTVEYDRLVKDGNTVRLVHSNRGCLLHSHRVAAAITKSHFEVSCYANLANSDSKDDWVIEIQGHEKSPSPDFQNEATDELHPISTNFRLRHKVLGCYLATTGKAYPAWGFQQGEVICKNTVLKQDKNTWWNIEDHVNEYLPNITTKYVPPKPRFWKEFILINYGMMASNNALVPDPNKYDNLASEWWEWPILRAGLRMGSWSANQAKYFLIGNPAVTLFSTFSLGVLAIYYVVVLWRWQRQKLVYQNVFDTNLNQLIAQSILPVSGWILHYLPFILMGRVTYLHHYVPAQYFATFVAGCILETLIYKPFKNHRVVVWVAFGISYTITVGLFLYLSPLSLGMTTSAKDYNHLKFFSSWMI